jgi:hypothetical protein
MISKIYLFLPSGRPPRYWLHSLLLCFVYQTRNGIEHNHPEINYGFCHGPVWNNMSSSRGRYGSSKLRKCRVATGVEQEEQSCLMSSRQPRPFQFDVIYHLPPALENPVTKYKMSSEIIVASWQHFFCLSNRIHLAPLYFWSTSVTFAVKLLLCSRCRHRYFWLVFGRFYICNAYDSAFKATSSNPGHDPFKFGEVFLVFVDFTRKVFRNHLRPLSPSFPFHHW